MSIFNSNLRDDLRNKIDELEQELAKLKEENEKYKLALEKITDLHNEDGSIMQRYAYEALGE